MHLGRKPPVRFYVGATLSRKKDWADPVADMLIANGWEQTFRWDTVERAEYPEQSVKELKGVLEADVFIGLLPGRLGLATELGIALADKAFRYGMVSITGALQPKRIVLWAPESKYYTQAEDGLHPSVFCAHPFMERIVGKDPVDTLRRYLINKDAVEGFVYDPE